MRGLRSFIVLGLLALPICDSTALYKIEITPESENGIYRMQPNDTMTFHAQGIKTDAETGGESEAPITKIWWNFSKDVLIKTASSGNSITLKAAKAGATQLSVSVMVDNYSFTRTVTILIGNQ